MADGKGATRRLLVSVDAKGYGSADGRRQAAMQRGLVDILAAGAEAAKLRRFDWDRQPGGDGEFAVLPADEPEDVLIDDFVRETGDRLDDYNADLVAAARLRLRMAIHHGMAVPAANGYAGAGAVVVGRLVGCDPARAAQLAAPDASLVVVISNRVYLDTVAQGHTRLRPSRLRRVTVRVKEYTDEAWLYVPGHDVHALDLRQPAPPPAAEGSGPRPPADGAADRGAVRRYRAEVISEFNGPVTANVIGINKAGRDG